MHRTYSIRYRLLAATAALVFFTASAAPAHATSKEIIELQTQVQQLLDMVQRLQSTLDTRFAVVQHLAEQTADNANRMTAAVTALQQKIAAQNEATNGKLDSTSGQMQSLNDSVDEVKSRVVKLDKAIQDLQTQLQAMQNPPPTAVPANGTAQPGTTPGTPMMATPGGAPMTNIVPAPVVNQAPPLQETFQAGLRDYNAARFDVASGEFQDVLHYYPLDDLAGQSQFYLGEILYKHQKLTEAVKAYNAVLEGFPGNPKAPTAQLHKAQALLQMNRKDAGIHELRLLISRHPQTPEAAQARNKLNALGAKPSAAH